MHKRALNEVRIPLTLKVKGPILIKSGQEGMDPTRPDMEFMRTRHPDYPDHETIFIPGSSLKGAIRAHAERILRTFHIRCCDPLTDDGCTKTLEKQVRAEAYPGETGYALACAACRLFGCGFLASRARFADAFPAKPISEEVGQRTGVAIDRVLGSVAVGPFQMEALTAGVLHTSITLSNFELWQLALLGLVLRDLEAGRLPVGFGKSRGFGDLRATMGSIALRVFASEGVTVSRERLEIFGAGVAAGVEPPNRRAGGQTSGGQDRTMSSGEQGRPVRERYGMRKEEPVTLLLRTGQGESPALDEGTDFRIDDDEVLAALSITLESKKARDVLFRECVNKGWVPFRDSPEALEPDPRPDWARRKRSEERA